MSANRTFLVVIPAFREHNRLPPFLDELLPAVRDSGLDIRIRIVDDGSGEEEQRLLQELVRPLQADYPFLEDPILNAAHHGKGYCVYTGWRREPVTAEFLAFVDADGSIAADEMLRLTRLAAASDHPRLLLFASRQAAAGRVLQRRFMRQTLNRVFTWLVNRLFRLAVHDSQCGFKIVAADYFRSIAGEVREDGFCFDVELLALARADGVTLQEEPVHWIHRHSNRVHVLVDGIAMLIGLFRLRYRLNRP